MKKKLITTHMIDAWNWPDGTRSVLDTVIQRDDIAPPSRFACFCDWAIEFLLKCGLWLTGIVILAIGIGSALHIWGILK